jgi:hypothetical protein
LGLYYSPPPGHGGSGFDASLHGGSCFYVDLGDAIGYHDRVCDRGFGFSPTRHGRGGHAFDEQGSCFDSNLGDNYPPTWHGPGGSVFLLLGGAVQALTPILVALPATIVGPTTGPLGIGVVALALLLIGAAVLALRPISVAVAVLASMAMQTIHGFSTRPIRVVVVILMFLGAIFALAGLIIPLIGCCRCPTGCR